MIDQSSPRCSRLAVPVRAILDCRERPDGLSLSCRVILYVLASSQTTLAQRIWLRALAIANGYAVRW